MHRLANTDDAMESIEKSKSKFLFANESTVVELVGKEEVMSLGVKHKHDLECLTKLSIVGSLKDRYEFLCAQEKAHGPDKTWRNAPNIRGKDILMLNTGVITNIKVYMRAKIGGRVFRGRAYESNRKHLKTQSSACKQSYEGDDGRIVSTYGIIEHFAKYRPFAHCLEEIYAKVEWLHPAGTHESSGMPIYRRNPNLNWNRTHPYVHIQTIEAVNIVLIPTEGAAGNQRAFVVCEWEDVG
jgi:hypothetical protein